MVNLCIMKLTIISLSAGSIYTKFKVVSLRILLTPLSKSTFLFKIIMFRGRSFFYSAVLLCVTKLSSRYLIVVLRENFYISIRWTRLHSASIIAPFC